MRRMIFALFGVVSICYGQYGERINFPEKSIVAVSGYGTVNIKPDIAELDIGYYMVSTQIDKAKDTIDSKLNHYIERVNKLTGKKIETTVKELQIRNKNGDTLNIERSIKLRIFEIRQIDSILQIAYKFKMNKVGVVIWNNSKINTYQDSAFTLAAEDARSKANSLAKKFNRKLGKAYQIVNEYRNNLEGSRGSYTSPGETKLYNEMSLTVPDVRYSAHISVIFELID